jgi:hypothetical protein
MFVALSWWCVCLGKLGFARHVVTVLLRAR